MPHHLSALTFSFRPEFGRQGLTCAAQCGPLFWWPLLALSVVSVRCGIRSAIRAYQTSSSNQARFMGTRSYPSACDGRL